jgi:hypothetical protein
MQAECSSRAFSGERVITSGTLGHIHWDVSRAWRGRRITSVGSKGAPTMHGAYSQIIAIDLGKFNSVVCVYNPADAAHRFQSLATAPRAVHDLLSALIRMPDDAARILVVFETCEVCGWVHDVATALASPSPSPTRVTRRGGGRRSSARPTRTTR